MTVNLWGVPLTIETDGDKEFLAEAKSQGLLNLAGHRSVGGCRASIYNAMPLEGVAKLCKSADSSACWNQKPTYTDRLA